VSSLWIGEYQEGETGSLAEFAVADAILEPALLPRFLLRNAPIWPSPRPQNGGIRPRALATVVRVAMPTVMPSWRQY
jgi:hypothetical protein